MTRVWPALMANTCLACISSVCIWDLRLDMGGYLSSKRIRFNIRFCLELPGKRYEHASSPLVYNACTRSHEVTSLFTPARYQNLAIYLAISSFHVSKYLILSIKYAGILTFLRILTLFPQEVKPPS
jgi:hypothetical protein